MNWTDRRQRYRELLEGDACVHPASVFDPISARIAEELGFEAGMLPGSIASFTVLGNPDLILLTLTEFAQQAYRVDSAATLPLMVDADHGYGNALNVMRAIRELETAGVAGITIEDSSLPGGFGEKKTGLISIEEGVGKMRAALAAREDPYLVIIGRTAAAAITGIEDAIARAKAYEAAGIDALFFTGMNEANLEAMAEAVRIPLMLGGGGAAGAMSDRTWLAGRGVRIALQGNLVFSASVQAIYDTMKALREGAAPAELKDIASAETMSRLTREGEWKGWSERFLG
jgi:carboxyvinyl-carboxyphosphonate phosphorylmutase